MLHAYRSRSILRKCTLLHSRFINCNSCGIELQNKNIASQGYYIESTNDHKIDIDKDIEKLKYLLFSQDIQSLKDGEISDRSATVKTPPVCKRCVDAISQNKYDIKDFPKILYDDIFKDIPLQSNLLHVVSFPEFPLNLNAKLLKNKHYNTSLVLTKADQVVPNKAILQKDTVQFLKDFLKIQLKISSNKTVVISALKNWNIETLFSMLKSKTFLFGNANVGKSTLINSLIKNYIGKKITIDKKGNVIDDDKYKARNMKQYLKNQNAGVFYVPNMTRSLQSYDINGKVVYDLPGYSEDINETYLENIISKDWLQRVRKTELFDDKKIKKKTYVTIKGTENGACYTVGGIFFIVPPAGTINQIVKFVPGEFSTYKNVDKALEVFKECNTPDSVHPMKKYCGITSNAANKNEFVRHVLPPFQGSIEIVLKDIGYMLLRTTGRYEYHGLHEIWLPKGIEICIREPLEKTIRAGYSDFIHSKGALPSCPKDRPIVSNTYPMEFDEADTLKKMREIYLSRTDNDLSSRRFKDVDPKEILMDIHDKPINLYWYYKW